MQFQGNIIPNESQSSTLYSEKIFLTWKACENFLNEWVKRQGFRIIKARVHRNDGIIRRRSFMCDHERFYESNSTRNTVTKKTQCPFIVNVLCPKSITLKII